MNGNSLHSSANYLVWVPCGPWGDESPKGLCMTPGVPSHKALRSRSLLQKRVIVNNIRWSTINKSKLTWLLRNQKFSTLNMIAWHKKSTTRVVQKCSINSKNLKLKINHCLIRNSNRQPPLVLTSRKFQYLWIYNFKNQNVLVFINNQKRREGNLNLNQTLVSIRTKAGIGPRCGLLHCYTTKMKVRCPDIYLFIKRNNPKRSFHI